MGARLCMIDPSSQRNVFEVHAGCVMTWTDNNDPAAVIMTCWTYMGT